LPLITGEARDRCTQQFEGCLYQCPLTTWSAASFTQNEWSLLASAIALTNVILPRLPLFQRPLFLPSLSYRVRIIAQDLPSASSRAQRRSFVLNFVPKRQTVRKLSANTRLSLSKLQRSRKSRKPLRGHRFCR